MKQRTAILLAMGLTVFVMVLVSAIAFNVFAKTLTAEAESSKPALVQVQAVGGGVGEPINVPAVLASPTVPPTLRPIQTVPSTAQPKIISADRAFQIALVLYPGSKLQSTPELVNYKGKMAYEVLLSSGAVYVDAFSGKVLANIISVASNTAPPQESAPSGDNGGNDNGGGNSGNDNGGNVGNGGNDNAFVPSIPPQYDPPQVNPPAQNGDNHGDDGHDKKDGKKKHKHDDDGKDD